MSTPHRHGVQSGQPATSTIPLIREAWERGLSVLKPTSAQLEKGLALHEEALVIDTFGFLPMGWNEQTTQDWNALVEANLGGDRFHLKSGLMRALSPTFDESSGIDFLEAIRVSGLTGMVHTAAEGKSHDEDVKRLAAGAHICGWFGDQVGQVRRPDDFQQAWEKKRFAVAFSVNGPPCPGNLNFLEEEIQWLSTWYHLGVRLMHLSYNRQNVIATGCVERNDAGLSELGYEFVRMMNRVGIIVDVPHSSENTSLQAAETSDKPIMASHVCCRAVYDHMRNKSDRVLKAIADTGGLVGITSRPAFLGPDATIVTLLDHLDHAFKTIGEDHVAIGTDTTYVPPYAEGIKPRPQGQFSEKWWGAWWQQKRHTSTTSEDHRYGSLAWTNWPLMTVGLVMRGYKEETIRKILGLNLLRVMEANQPEVFVLPTP